MSYPDIIPLQPMSLPSAKVFYGDFMEKVAFISGHLGISESEWNEHYVPKIDEAISLGHRFVVGDARGVDVMAQLHLNSKGVRNVTVYHMFKEPRFNKGGFNTKGGYESDDERDSAMTKNSDYDIAWVRPGKEKSGTAKNIKRRTHPF
jgi:hypothetical protein